MVVADYVMFFGLVFCFGLFLGVIGGVLLGLLRD